MPFLFFGVFCPPFSLDGSRMSAALQPYKNGFSNPNESFVTFHDIAADKTLASTTFTRGEFWELGKKAAAALNNLAAARGDRILHVFSGVNSRRFVLPRFSELAVHRQATESKTSHFASLAA